MFTVTFLVISNALQAAVGLQSAGNTSLASCNCTQIKNLLYLGKQSNKIVIGHCMRLFVVAWLVRINHYQYCWGTMLQGYEFDSYRSRGCEENQIIFLPQGGDEIIGVNGCHLKGRGISQYKILPVSTEDKQNHMPNLNCSGSAVFVLLSYRGRWSYMIKLIRCFRTFSIVLIFLRSFLRDFAPIQSLDQKFFIFRLWQKILPNIPKTIWGEINIVLRTTSSLFNTREIWNPKVVHILRAGTIKWFMNVCKTDRRIGAKGPVQEPSMQRQWVGVLLPFR